MLTPTPKPTSSPQAQPSESDSTAGKKFKAEVATNEQASRPSLSDGGQQVRAIFGEAATQLKENSRLKAELTQTGSQHILATSLMSRSAERLEISLPAERVDGGWKAKVASRENGQSTQNLAAVRSDETGKWTIMPDKMEATGQHFSRPQRYTKSVDNPVKGPYTARQGAEIAAKMLSNISHLEGNDFMSAGPSSRSSSGVGSAENIMKAINSTQGMPGQVFVYEVGGEPAAVMKGKMRDDLDRSFHVNFVVSDPYARGAGTAMLEKAVNVSLENGGGGVVTLEANSAGATDQYRKLGFEDYAPQSTPRASCRSRSSTDRSRCPIFSLPRSRLSVVGVAALARGAAVSFPRTYRLYAACEVAKGLETGNGGACRRKPLLDLCFCWGVVETEQRLAQRPFRLT